MIAFLLNPDVIKEYITPLVVGLVGWLLRITIIKSAAKATELYHQFVTANSNRIRDEVMVYVDAKFKEHERTEVECIKSLRNTVDVLEKLAGIIKEKDK